MVLGSSWLHCDSQAAMVSGDSLQVRTGAGPYLNSALCDAAVLPASLGCWEDHLR